MFNESWHLPMLCLAILCFVVLLAAIGRDKRRLRRRRQQQGLSWLRGLRVFLAQVQQHRGLSTGYLNGNESALNDIKQLQQKIKRNISDICSEDPWLDRNKSWQALNSHWHDLSAGFANNTAANNIKQHNSMIRNLLYLIDDMALAHDLLLLKTHANKPLHLAWRELLNAAEFIGQARALGTGVSAAGSCDSVSRIQLNYLCQKIRSETDRVWQDIPPDSLQHSKLQELLSCIRREIIVERPSIQPDDYFGLASDALDGMHAQYDALVDSYRTEKLRAGKPRVPAHLMQAMNA